MSGMSVPEIALAAVTVKDNFVAGERKVVKGMDFEEADCSSMDALAASMVTMGFQATHVGAAIEEINRMLSWRLSDVPIKDSEGEAERDPKYRSEKRATIFLAYTSNMISSGMRETIKFLVKNKLVECVVTTAGGIEEDFIKCLAPTYVGDFKLNGKKLRKEGVNRLGNLLVPNSNYCMFEDWVNPILNDMTDELNAGE